MWRGIARLGVSTAGIAAAIFSVCAAGVALAPPATTTVLGDLLHAQLSGLPQSVTWSRFLGASLIWTAGTTLVVVVVAWLYHRLWARKPEGLTLRPRLTVTASPVRRLDDTAPARGHGGRTARLYRPLTLTGSPNVSEPPARPGRRPSHRAG